MMIDPPDTLSQVLRVWPDLRIPNGMTLQGLEAVSEIILAWQRREDDFADDYRGLKLAAKLCEYFRAMDRPLIVGKLPDATVEALKESRMDDRHAALNALMQD
jgi:hypothetical protein